MDNMNQMIALLLLQDYFREANQCREQRALRDADNPPLVPDERQASLLRRIARCLRAAAALPTPLVNDNTRAPMH